MKVGKKNLDQRVKAAMLNWLVKTQQKHGIVLSQKAKRQLQITEKIKSKLEKDPKEKWGTDAVLKHHAAVKQDPNAVQTHTQMSDSESDFDMTPRRDADV